MRLSVGSRRIRTGMIWLGVLTVVGTSYFFLVEGFTFVEALYQTVTIYSTVGLGEAHKFSSGAMLVSVVLMAGGVTVIFITLGGAFEDAVYGELNWWRRKRMTRNIEGMSNHVVLCGYGRVGGQIAKQLSRDKQLVVVERAKTLAEEAVSDGFPIVLGDATDDAVLSAAGADRASMIILSLGSDADAISAVLSARELARNARIVVRVNESQNEGKVMRAGADHIVNPLLIGARRLAAFALQPAVADFLDVVSHSGLDIEYRLEEFAIERGSAVAGKALDEVKLRESTGALVLAIREPDGGFLSNPPASTTLEPGDVLIAIGEADQLASLGRAVST